MKFSHFGALEENLQSVLCLLLILLPLLIVVVLILNCSVLYRSCLYSSCDLSLSLSLQSSASDLSDRLKLAKSSTDRMTVVLIQENDQTTWRTTLHLSSRSS